MHTPEEPPWDRPTEALEPIARRELYLYVPQTNPFDYEAVLQAGMHQARMQPEAYGMHAHDPARPYMHFMPVRLGENDIEVGKIVRPDSAQTLQSFPIVRPFDLYVMRGSVKVSIRKGGGDVQTPPAVVAGSATRPGIVQLVVGYKLFLTEPLGHPPSAQDPTPEDSCYYIARYY